MASLSLCLVLFVAAVQAGPPRPSTSTSTRGCEIRATIFEEKSPLLMYHGVNKTGLIYPETSDGIIRVQAGKTVRLACTRGQESSTSNTMKKITGGFVNSLNKETIILKCKEGEKFYLEPDTVISNGGKGKGSAKKSNNQNQPKDETVYEIKQFFCFYPCKTSFGIKEPEERCATGNPLKEIKFLSSDGEKHVVLDYCRHSSQDNGFTRWSHSIVHPWTPIPTNLDSSWSNFETIGAINEKTMFPDQRKSLCHSIKQLPNCTTIKERLDRGHLVARADMFYPAEQAATYDYANTMPQWNPINQGNWEKIEKAVRKLASDRGRNLDVWTGQVGNMKFKYQELYLNRQASKPKAPKVPIPEHIFKLVYDSKAGQGVAIVTIHNPYLTDGANLTESIKCTDVSSLIQTMNNDGWKEFKEGYTFCCKIGDFMQKYEITPPLKLRGATVGLLTF